MTEAPASTFFSRLGGWLKRGPLDGATSANSASVEAPSPELSAAEKAGGDFGSIPVVSGSIEPRSTFLRPWTRKDATIEHLQTGMLAITDVMGTIRNSLDRQAKRQDEMMRYLILLPQLLQQLPDNARAQREALLSIQQQLEKQSAQDSQFARVLDRISRADGEQRRGLDALQDRVEWINRNEHALTQSLSNVGLLLQNMSQHADINSHVLRQMRDTLGTRETDLTRAVRRQGRLTALLLTGFVLAATAAAATTLLNYFGVNVLGHFLR